MGRCGYKVRRNGVEGEGFGERDSRGRVRRKGVEEKGLGERGS